MKVMCKSKRSFTLDFWYINDEISFILCRTGRPTLVVRASSDVKYEVAPEGPKDYLPALGVVAFVAAVQGRLHITCAPHTLYHPEECIALY